MHLIRRLKSTFNLVLGNTPVIGLPISTIIYYVALGNPGRNTWYGKDTWYVYAHAFACCRIMCLRQSSLIGTMSEMAYDSRERIPGIWYYWVRYPLGTHIPVKTTVKDNK